MAAPSIRPAVLTQSTPRKRQSISNFTNGEMIGQIVLRRQAILRGLNATKTDSRVQLLGNAIIWRIITAPIFGHTQTQQTSKTG
jgi:hypothetical protein